MTLGELRLIMVKEKENEDRRDDEDNGYGDLQSVLKSLLQCDQGSSLVKEAKV